MVRRRSPGSCLAIVLVLFSFVHWTQTFETQGLEQKKISYCTYLTGRYHPKVFAVITSFECYRYLNPSLINSNGRVNITTCSITIGTRPTDGSVIRQPVPCYDPQNGDEPIPFNYSNPKLMDAVSSSLRRYEDGRKLVECSNAAMECCLKMLNSESVPAEGRCRPQWDAWYCWIDGGTPGTLEKGVCPGYIYSNNAPSCKHYHTKECFTNGTWKSKTDYSTCSVTPQISARSIFHVIVLSISLLTAIPALIIFFSYRKLQVMRVILHRSLILAFAARNTLAIISTTTVLLPELYAGSVGIMEENGVPCRVLASFERLSANAVFACMLLEGVNLHCLITNTFRMESIKTPAIVLATILTVGPALAWSVVMATLQDSNCWYVDSDNTGYQWINDGPRIGMLVVNTILIIDIARVIITKLRSVNNARVGKLRRTAKATLLLMPLFGIQLLVTVVRPNTDDCVAEQIYYFFSYAMDGLQGFLVILIYCFLNNEVQELLRRSWTVWTGGFGTSSSKPDVTSRRGTLFTSLPVPLHTDGIRRMSSIDLDSMPPRQTVAKDLFGNIPEENSSVS